MVADCGCGPGWLWLWSSRLQLQSSWEYCALSQRQLLPDNTQLNSEKTIPQKAPCYYRCIQKRSLKNPHVPSHQCGCLSYTLPTLSILNKSAPLLVLLCLVNSFTTCKQPWQPRCQLGNNIIKPVLMLLPLPPHTPSFSSRISPKITGFLSAARVPARQLLISSKPINAALGWKAIASGRRWGSQELAENDFLS